MEKIIKTDAFEKDIGIVSEAVQESLVKPKDPFISALKNKVLSPKARDNVEQILSQIGGDKVFTALKETEVIDNEVPGIIEHGTQFGVMNWESFMDNLTARQMVPVIGNDLILVKNDKDTPEPLHRYLAKIWTNKLGVPYKGQTLGELALAYPESNIMITTDALLPKMDEDRFCSESLIKLAEITDFRFFISTTLDDLLVKALLKTRKIKQNQLRVINYSPGMISTSLDEVVEEPLVTVFNLFGNFGNAFSPTFDEEEMLEHLISLSKNVEYHGLEDYFMEQVRNKILLFIGCDFPDWFMRFFIRIITNERYRNRLYGDYIVYEERNNPELVKFLKQFNWNIITLDGVPGRNVVRFIDELHKKWTEVLEKQPIKYEGSVFLSYNYPDRSEARELKKLLRTRGIQGAWLDKDDLDVGEHRLIKEEIIKCKVFVPFISNNSLSNTRGYMWSVEWEIIKGRLEADKYYGYPTFQMIPVILDDTDRNDRRIPEFMRKYTMWNFRQNQDRIIEVITDALTPLESNK